MRWGREWIALDIRYKVDFSRARNLDFFERGEGGIFFWRGYA